MYKNVSHNYIVIIPTVLAALCDDNDQQTTAYL